MRSMTASSCSAWLDMAPTVAPATRLTKTGETPLPAASPLAKMTTPSAAT